MRVLLVFDKFKHALSAGAACAVAARALQTNHPDWEIDRCPLSDGGEGFVEILTGASGGFLKKLEVSGPMGRPVRAKIGIVHASSMAPAARERLDLGPGLSPDARIAVVEMAAASGLNLLHPSERNPWRATSYGTGELVVAAGKLGCAAVVLGVGGSATNDLGLGALAALGIEFRAADGTPVNPPTPEAWPRIERICGGIAPGVPPVRIACDVRNPLLGPRGCATVFGPQKGLRAEDLARLEHASARMAMMLCAHTGQPDSLMDAPGTGAAGGIAFGLTAAAHARLLPGFAWVSDWLDLDRRIAAADVVITGEGCFDRSSLEGKGPGEVVARAAALHRGVHVFAGTIGDGTTVGALLHAITPPGLSLDSALPATADLLHEAIRRQFP